MPNNKLWKIIAEVEHNGKKFAIVKKNNRALFFLEKLGDDKYTYPTMDDYVFLSKKLNFTFNKGISYSSSFGLDNLYVRVKSSGKEKLVSLAVAAGMLLASTGCDTNTKKYTNDTSANTYASSSEVTTTPTTTYSDSNTEFYKDFGVTLEPCPGLEGEYFVTAQDPSKCNSNYGRNYYNNVLSVEIKEAVTPSDVQVYLPEINVSYKQVEDLIDKMDLIDVDKNYLKKGLNNLKTSGLDINLDILYYNLKKSKVSYWDSSNGQTNESFASFNCIDHIINLPKQRNQFSDQTYFKIICHEFFGHGLVTTYVDEYSIYCSLTKLGLVLDESHNLLAAGKVGVSLDEGYSEVISTYATGQKISMYNSNYTVPTYQLLTLLSILEVSLDDFSKRGIDALYEASNKRGFTSSYVYLDTFDEYMDLQISGLKFDNVVYNNYISSIYLDNYDALCKYKGSDEEVNKIYLDSLYKYEDFMEPDVSPQASFFYDVNSSNSEIIVNADEVCKNVETFLEEQKNKKTK